MAQYETRWKLVGNKSELLHDQDGMAISVNPGQVVDPARDRAFERLRKSGDLQEVRVLVEEDAPVEPEEEAPAQDVVAEPEDAPVEPEPEEVEASSGLIPSDIEARKKITKLGLSKKLEDKLEAEGFFLVEDLRGVTRDELKAIKGVGDKYADDVFEAVSAFDE